MKLDSKGAFEDAFSNSVYQLEGLKENLAQVRKSVALDLAVETLCKLEQENGQDPEYQKNRAIILNHITKFGSTRDWSASDDVNKQADAADSVLALVQGLEDGTNVDMLLGGDSRLDDARLNIKLNAAKRKIEANGIGHRQQAFTRQSDLIKAEHHLSIAKRRLTSRLEAADHQGIQKADPDQIGGFGARDDNQVHGRKLVTSAFGRNPRYVDQKANRSTKSIWWRKASPLGRLFGTHSMGGVKMDARLLNAVAHDKAGKKRVQQINLLMASVGRWQDEVDKAKDAIDQADGTTTPRTQAEKRLMDHAQQPRTFIQSELRRLNNRKNQLELKANNDDAELADTDDVDEDSGLSLEEQQELAECIRDIDKLNRESQSYQQRLANGPNIPLPHRHQNTQLGGFESQVAQERQQHQRIKDDLGQFSDYGIDKKTARDVFVKHNALATKDERGRPQNEQTSQQTRRQLNIDDRRPPSQFTVDQEQLVKQSIKNLTKTKMVSTDDAIAGSKAIKQIAGDVFNETSNIMAMQMEVSSDFSPEVQANEFQRAVLQTYTSDHSASVSANDDQTQTKMMARTQPLQMALTNDKRRYDQLAYQYHDHSIQMAAAKQSEQRLEQEYNQALEPIDKSIDDEQAKKERNRRDKIINDYHYKSNQEGLKLQHHQTQLNQVRTQLRQNHYYQKNELATAENRVTREMSDEHGIQQQTARQYERQVANTLNTRKTLFPHLDQRVANNAANGQAAAPPLEHRDMINILRAAVLSARKPGTRMDQYNPALHKADIEQTLTNWGILPELVRPELDDIMTTRLDKDEIERWQKDFKDIDTSRGAGDKLYSGSAGKQMAKPFYGAGPANFKDKHVKQRVDHQVRHLNAQIDEMTPGSKLRVSYQSSKDIDASVTAKKGVVAAEIEGDIEWGSDSEIEILCHDDSYDMQIKPGSHLAASISASASLQLGKFVNLGASLGIDLEHTHFNGIILKFDREDDPEAAKQKLQKFVEAMARGEDLSVDEWNGLTDNVQLVYEKQNQGGVEAGVKAEANLTDDLLGNTAAAKLSLGATGQMLGRTKTHVITDAESLTLEAEKKYSYQATADIDMDVRLAFGQSPNKSNLPDVNAHNQSSQNFQAGSDELGKGTIQSGPLKGTGANINVDLELGASTTWERRAYAKSKVTMNRSTGLIEKAELDFESTMNGNTMDTDEKRQKTAFKLLKRLGTWSGHGAEIDRMIGPEAVPNDLRRDLNEVFKHTSGSDFLNLKLALKEDKKDEANELLAQANELDDPSKGRVTEATKEEAAKLRKQAQKILDNRANFYPQKVNLIPTQDDEISRSGDYFPGVSELAGSKYGSGPVGVPLGFTDPAIQISKQMGGQLASWSPASGKLVMTATERSNLKHELGNEHNLGWQAPAKDQFFAGNGDTVIEPPSISSPSPSPPSSNIGADDNNEQIIDLNLNRNLSTDSHDDADDNDEILISSQNDASGPAKSPKSSNVNGASNVQQLLQQDKLFERDRAHFLAYAQPKKNIKLYTAEAQKQNSQYYQESQHGAQCGKHAINAYFGGPVITNMDQMTAFTAANRLLGYKNDHADKQVINTQLGNDHDNVPDYVNWAITKGNIRGASPIETSKINNVNEVDMPKNVDRCIVMTHGQETSHFVAFRRNTNGDWRLIDSLNAQKKQLNNKQPKMTPEQYIQQKLKTQQKTSQSCSINRLGVQKPRTLSWPSQCFKTRQVTSTQPKFNMRDISSKTMHPIACSMTSNYSVSCTAESLKRSMTNLPFASRNNSI